MLVCASLFKTLTNLWMGKLLPTCNYNLEILAGINLSSCSSLSPAYFYFWIYFLNHIVNLFQTHKIYYHGNNH